MVPGPEQVKGGAGVPVLCVGEGKENGQHASRAQRDQVMLDAGQAPDGMPGPAFKQFPDPLRSVGRYPGVGDVVGIAFRGDPVIGADDVSGCRVVDPRQFVEGDVAHPVVGAGPAGRRQVAKTSCADRHAAGGDKADIAFAVGEDDVHLRCDQVAQPVDESREIRSRGGEHKRLAAAVVLGEGRPRKGKDMPRLQESRVLPDHAGDHRAVTGPAHGKPDRLPAAHPDRLGADIEGQAAPGGEIVGGVHGIDPLDEQVLDIRRGVGEAPGEVTGLAEHGEGQSRQGGAGDFEVRRADMGEVPDARHVQSQVRIVCQQRETGLRVCTGQCPAVGSEARPLPLRHRAGKRRVVDADG